MTQSGWHPGADKIIKLNEGVNKVRPKVEVAAIIANKDKYKE